MALQQRYNNEDIFIRGIIAGLLNIFNNKINYNQVWSNDVVETINVPFYYNQSGDERFMQEFFTHYADCAPRKIDGNFDAVPRGILTYTGSTIDSTRTTSRYVQGHYMKEIGGQLQTYRSFLYSIPLNINFDCDVWADTQITALKIEQAIREVFYKTVTFYTYFRGMRVGSTVGFPEDITLEKNIQYSFESENKIKLKFILQVESYQPVFDPTTEVNADEYITGLGYRLYPDSQSGDGYITITTPTSGTAINPVIVPKGYPLLIEWETKEEAIINRVDLHWVTSGESDATLIEKLVPNHEYYIWNIPETFTNYKHPAIIWDPSAYIYRKPVIRIIPDTSTKIIDASSFYIDDPGYFLTFAPDISIAVVLEMKNTAGRVVYTGDTSLYFNIINNKIDETNPVAINGTIVFPGDVDYKLINIHVSNSVTSYTGQEAIKPVDNIFGVVKYLKII
jgi:hypothetical protein